ncbi:hypothetical protein GALMADRAFT_1358846 [Galerina marginata CBS 339.88]|uniref:DUF6534 domain-containing protein n=1 Tax=Galerina marginata (strain CBS 339.88) TaxID=685588 RepID=A0A067S7Z5_GALM3|nr:hypothetical protein GALMADRAFT_1358846 [Galerina marginata CBS 339.88]
MAEASAAVPPFGSEVILLLFSCALWGATCLQTFIYFLHFSHRDPLAIKLLARKFAVYRLSVTQWGNWMSLYGRSPYFLYVHQKGNSVKLTVMSSDTGGFFGPVILYSSSLEFEPKKPDLLYFVIYTALVVLSYKGDTGARFLPVNLLLAGLAISAATDVLIAGSLLYFVWKLRGTDDVRLPSTSKLLERVVVLTATVWVTSPAFTGVAFLICPLYCNMLLANLNMRESVRCNSFSVVSGMTFARTTGEAVVNEFVMVFVSFELQISSQGAERPNLKGKKGSNAGESCPLKTVWIPQSVGLIPTWKTTLSSRKVSMDEVGESLRIRRRALRWNIDIIRRTAQPGKERDSSSSFRPSPREIPYTQLGYRNGEEENKSFKTKVYQCPGKAGEDNLLYIEIRDDEQ